MFGLCRQLFLFLLWLEWRLMCFEMRYTEMAYTLSVILSKANCNWDIWSCCGLKGFCTALTFCNYVPSQILSALPSSRSKSAFSNQDFNIWVTMVICLSSHWRRMIFSDKTCGSKKLFMCRRISNEILFSLHTLLKKFGVFFSSAVLVLSKIVFLSMSYGLVFGIIFKFRISLAICMSNFTTHIRASFSVSLLSWQQLSHLIVRTTFERPLD